MNHQSSEEIANIIAEKEKELNTAIDNQATVEQEILLISKKILESQFKKKDLQIVLSKANRNVKVLQGELRILRNQFFSAKNAGL